MSDSRYAISIRCGAAQRKRWNVAASLSGVAVSDVARARLDGWAAQILREYGLDDDGPTPSPALPQPPSPA